MMRGEEETKEKEERERRRRRRSTQATVLHRASARESSLPQHGLALGHLVLDELVHSEEGRANFDREVKEDGNREETKEAEHDRIRGAGEEGEKKGKRRRTGRGEGEEDMEIRKRKWSNEWHRYQWSKTRFKAKSERLARRRGAGVIAKAKPKDLRI